MSFLLCLNDFLGNTVARSISMISSSYSMKNTITVIFCLQRNLLKQITYNEQVIHRSVQ